MSEIVQDGGSVTIKPGSDIVASGVDKLKKELKGVVEGGLSSLIIDMSEVRMLDSMGIGLLIATYNSLKKNGTPMELIHVSADIATLLKNMRLNQYFNIS
ncbi:MAG: STAS domain-containing protein [Proteobacteria bacterium]|nr:STAS domain-containing protein [Pseudomonadota bacterium]